MANKQQDTLGITSAQEGLPVGWDWKGEYVSGIGKDGLERFSQGSATPDTTLLFAGPARFTGIGGDTTKLHPIGLVNGFGFTSQAQLQRLFEIGSNRSFFTRGKTISQLQLSSFLADQQSLMRVLSTEAWNQANGTAGDYKLNASGTKAPGVDDFYMNLDSEVLAVPFGVMMVFKTKGSSSDSGETKGTILGATYLEYCMLNGFQFQVDAQSPVIAQNVGIEFDRAVPVALVAK